MSAAARRISIAGMRSRDPALSEAAARARLLRRLLGARRQPVEMAGVQSA